MRIEREAFSRALCILEEEGYLVVESRPRAGLTLFLSQVGSHLMSVHRGRLAYINAGVSGTSVITEMGERLGCEWTNGCSLREFISALETSAPVVLVIDGAENIPQGQQAELNDMLRAFKNERMFRQGLSQVHIVVGTNALWEGARLQLGYFTRTEVARLLRRKSDDRVALALYAWARGAPELTRDLATALTCNETNPGAVYAVVRESATRGRLRHVAAGKPSIHELRKLGLAEERVVPAVKLAMKLASACEPGLTINRETMEVRYQGRLLALFPQEARILCLLAGSPGRVFTPAQIYDSITGGQGLYLGEKSVKAQVSRLRQKLPEGTEWIITRRGLGYAFNPQCLFTLV